MAAVSAPAALAIAVDLDEVVAGARLRDREENLPRKLQRLFVDGGHIGGKGADRDAEMALDEMLSERRRMGRAAARARHHDVWRMPFDVAQELGHGSLERVVLPHGIGIGTLPPFRFHVDGDVAHRGCLAAQF